MTLFEYGAWWNACVTAVLLAGAGLLWARRRSRARSLRLLSRPRLAGAPGADALPWLALVAVGLALLGPRIGETTLRVPGSGLDLVILVDVSRSMDARDVAPSRLHRARRTARHVLGALLPQDRVALAAFAGHGVLLTPLSSDRDALAELLPALDTELLGSTGSNLEDGVRAALDAFGTSGDRARSVLLLSDGERPGQAGRLPPLRGIRIVGVAIGSDEGARIPLPSRPGGWLRDSAGEEVVSRRHPARLSALAERSDGATFVADAWGEVDRDALVAELRRDAGRTPGESVERRVPAVRRLPFAALAFALLLFETLPPALRRPRSRAPRLLLLAATLTLLGAGSGTPGARRLVSAGIEYAEGGDTQRALETFRSAAVTAGNAELAALAWYDYGVSALSLGKLEAARDAFFDALAIAPDDDRARFNLEWTLAALAATPPPPAAADEGDEDPTSDAPEPRPEPAPPPPAVGRTAPPPSLDPAEAERWLAAVNDDPARALRRAAREAGADRPRSPRDAATW